MTETTRLTKIANVLQAHGTSAHGGDVDQAAAEWHAAGHTPDDVDNWLGAGMWDADQAATLKDRGFCPSDLTSGHPSEIYKCANCEITADQLIAIITWTPGCS